MAKYAQLPDGTMLEFPDDIKDSVMDAVVARHMQPKQHTPVPGVAHDTGGGMSWGDVAGSAVKNIPASALRAGGEMWDAVTSPGETLMALVNIALGGVQKLIPGQQDSEKYADAVGQYFEDRYGGMENFKRTLAVDPVGVLSDLSTIFTGGAGLMKGAGKLAKVAGASRAGNALQSVGHGVQAAGNVTDPLYLTGKTAGKLTDLAYGKDMSAAAKTYISALVPSTVKQSPEDVQTMANAAVANRIPITLGGKRKNNAAINRLNAELDAKIAAADAAGRTFDPLEIAENAINAPARSEIALYVDPLKDLRAYDKTLDNYLTAHSEDVSIGLAQAMKKATYRGLEKQRAFNNNVSVLPGSVEARYELASQLRQAIEKVVPEAKSINAQEGPRLALQRELDRALIRTANHPPISLPAAVLGSGIGGFTGNLVAGLASALATSFLGYPGMKSRIAFALDDLSRKGVYGPLHNAAATGYMGGSAQNIPEWYQKQYGGLLGMLAAGDGFQSTPPVRGGD